MAVTQTLSIIKPDAVRNNHIGGIYKMLENNELNIVAAKMMHLSEEKAKQFYAEHDGKHFFDSLINFMTSGPIMVQVLAGEDAITRYRKLMGATNPMEAEPGTIRGEFSAKENMTENAVHGSDSEESAARESAFFFSSDEIFANRL